MNLADKIVSVLVKDGVDRFFMVTGGGAMFLNDAVAKSSDAKATFMHHEQSCAMAAVAYARQTGNPCCCIVTTGCGVTNAMTGLLDAWQDSVPVIFISGAVGAQYTTQPHIATVHGDAKKVRHLGVQEANCQDIVTPYTKHYQFLTRLSDLGDGLRELYSGRPGPIWIEIPLDSQSTPASEHAYYNTPNLRPNRSYLSPWSAKMLHKRLKLARRPLILAGAGIRQGRAVKSFNDFIKKMVVHGVYK
jgi:acetolactate synthase-1/2/3 large subunit